MMKQILFIVLLAIFITGCTTAPSSPSALPKNITVTPAAPSRARPTFVSPPNTVTPESTATIDSSLYIGYLKMVDASHGWALVSGSGLRRSYILRTEDAGTTWHDITPPQLITVGNGYYSFFGSLVALDRNTAWIVADASADDRNVLFGTVWRTDDGGLSWRPGNPLSVYRAGPGMYISGFETYLDFADSQKGWLRARVRQQMGHYFDTWFHTVDGGLNWTRLPIGCNDFVSCDYFFVDEATGFKNAFETFWSVTGITQTREPWRIEKTVDGGSTWFNIVLTPPSNLSANSFFGQNIPPSQVSDLRIQQSFTRFNSGAIGLRMDFFLYPANDLQKPPLVMGYSYITKDKGQTWQSFPFSGGLFFLTELTGWRFSDQGGKYLLEKTADGGMTWNSVGKELSEVGTLQFGDENTGWMIIQPSYSSMRLARTLDGGQTWMDITSNILEALASNILIENPPKTSTAIPPEPWIARMEAGSSLVLNAIHMFDAANGWGTSLNGSIFHTTDGGTTWQDVTPRYGADNDHNFSAVDALHAWTVIEPLPACIDQNSRDQCPDYYLKYGPVWYTRDGGQTWDPGGMFPDSERSFQAQPIEIRFANESSGWAQWLSRSPDGTSVIYHLYKTSDGGLTWEPFFTEAYQGKVHFLNERIGLRPEAYVISVKTLDDFMKGFALPILDKTEDGGSTWNPVRLPDFVTHLEDLHLDQNTIGSFWAHCDYPEVSFFGLRGIGVRYLCGLPDITQFFEYYYSVDEGQSWNNWVSLEYQYSAENNRQPGWEEWMLSADEFFLEGGMGWRLYKSGPDSLSELQRTVDGGKSWETINKVAWQQANLDFINKQEGWAIATNGDGVALLHTKDGGKNWEELQPIIASE